MYATSFTSNRGSGGTGNKTVISGNKFPIGSKIYYYNGDADIVTADLSSGNFTSLPFYDSFETVNARYSAVTGTNINLSGSSNSNVYLLVSIIENYKYWTPVGKSTEIIVTGNNLVSGNFYIYLGKTNGSDSYTFQLEDNNPLYYYDGTDLIEWSTYVASHYNSAEMVYRYCVMGTSVIGRGESTVSIGNVVNSGASFLDNLEGMPAGVYKVTLQRNVNWTTKPHNIVLALRFRNSSSDTWKYICHTQKSVHDVCDAFSDQAPVSQIGLDYFICVDFINIT
jgi:hypothetical protein